MALPGQRGKLRNAGVDPSGKPLSRGRGVGVLFCFCLFVCFAVLSWDRGGEAGPWRLGREGPEIRKGSSVLLPGPERPPLPFLTIPLTPKI